MAQLYLPLAHTEADLVLAGQIAEVIDSAELYVTWTPQHGRAVPEVVAELRAVTPTVTGAIALVVAAARELFAALRGRQPQRPALAARRRAARRAAEARELSAPQAASAWASVAGVSASRRLPARVLALGRLRALARPRLVELDAPLAVLALLQREPRAERLARAPLEAGHRPRRPARRDQLLRDRLRQRLARLALPDHEPAAGILARPAGEALAVLDDVAPADRARPEVGPRDADLLELGVELADRAARELGDVVHEALARLLAVLDPPEPVLPVAGQARRRQRVPVEQPDHVQPLLRAHQRAPLALDVADVDQPLDDRGARRRRADAGVLHRLAQLVVVDELAGGLHRGEQRRVGVAPRRLGLLALRADLERPDVLALRELRQRLVGALVVVRRTARPRSPRRRRRASRARPARARACGRRASATVVSSRVFSNTASGWKTARKRRATMS